MCCRMVDLVFIQVSHKDLIYDIFILKRDCITRNNKKSELDIAHTPSKRKIKLFADGILLYYVVRELNIALAYRNRFIDEFYTNTNRNVNAINFILVPANKEIVDYGWNYRMTYLLRERLELEHTLSWLSTLGGAFSALGDYGRSYAEVAGKISLNQLKLAFRLGDASVMSRCRLYFSLSLIQRHYFKLAKRIVYTEFTNAKNDVVIDNRLINMCKGIWCKLKYEYHVYKKCKNI